MCNNQCWTVARCRDMLSSEICSERAWEYMRTTMREKSFIRACWYPTRGTLIMQSATYHTPSAALLKPRRPIMSHAYTWTYRCLRTFFCLLHPQIQLVQKITWRSHHLYIVYSSIFLGSSIYSLTLTKNVTASRPSRSLWSYVRARYIICIIDVSNCHQLRL
jgi:hypothetical protein